MPVGQELASRWGAHVNPGIWLKCRFWLSRAGTPRFCLYHHFEVVWMGWLGTARSEKWGCRGVRLRGTHHHPTAMWPRPGVTAPRVGPTQAVPPRSTLTAAKKSLRLQHPLLCDLYSASFLNNQLSAKKAGVGGGVPRQPCLWWPGNPLGGWPKHVHHDLVSTKHEQQMWCRQSRVWKIYYRFVSGTC